MGVVEEGVSTNLRNDKDQIKDNKTQEQEKTENKVNKPDYDSSNSELFLSPAVKKLIEEKSDKQVFFVYGGVEAEERENQKTRNPQVYHEYEKTTVRSKVETSGGFSAEKTQFRRIRGK